MYDDNDMHNRVTYHTNSENWIFKILLIEKRHISPSIKGEIQNSNNEFAWLNYE